MNKRLFFLMALLASALISSYAAEYKISFQTDHYDYREERKVPQSFRGVHSFYLFRYISSEPTHIFFTDLYEAQCDTLINIYNVKAQVIKKKSPQYDVPFDDGIIFTKNGKVVCAMSFIRQSLFDGTTEALFIWYWDKAGKRRCIESRQTKFKGNEDPKVINQYKTLYNAVEQDSKKAPQTSKQTSAPKQTTTPGQNTAPKQTTTPRQTATPRQTQTTPAQPDKPMTASVINPRVIIKAPGADAHFPFQIFYEVTQSKSTKRYDFLGVQNVDTGEMYTDPYSGNQYFMQTDSTEPLLTMNVETEQMPAASPAKPLRLRMWILMSTLGAKEWVGTYYSPIYIWDGTYLRRE